MDEVQRNIAYEDQQRKELEAVLRSFMEALTVAGERNITMEYQAGSTTIRLTNCCDSGGEARGEGASE